MIDFSVAQWRKSSRSGDTGGQCVEVAVLAHEVAVRDSKDPDGPKLVIDSTVWRSLKRRIKANALDFS